MEGTPGALTPPEGELRPPGTPWDPRSPDLARETPRDPADRGDPHSPDTVRGSPHPPGTPLGLRTWVLGGLQEHLKESLGFGVWGVTGGFPAQPGGGKKDPEGLGRERGFVLGVVRAGDGLCWE